MSCCLVRIQGDKNKEKLKQWLSSADSAHQKEAEPVQQEDVDDLGTLSDYEFGEIAPVALALCVCMSQQLGNEVGRQVNYMYMLRILACGSEEKTTVNG